jgi:aryl-alcohol dehydrogenase-like predicted oxidoreductase
MQAGRATAAGTARYASRMGSVVADGHFRDVLGLKLGSIGMGSYLGAPDAATDDMYAAAARTVVSGGCNVLDAAINYRHQRSERSFGAGLAAAFEAGEVARDEIFVSTKAGFVAFDGDVPEDAEAWLSAYLEGLGVDPAAEVVAGYHCMHPAYLRDQIRISRENLGLETIDLLHIHNPETQLRELHRDDFTARMRAAFEALEQEVADGHIGAYGTATWRGYRVGPEDAEHLSLEALVELATDVAGEEHHFKAVQWPFNLAMIEVMRLPTQPIDGVPTSALAAAEHFGLATFISAPLCQGKLLGRLPEDLAEIFPEAKTDAQRALQFVRSAPGVAVPLVGMKHPDHIAENLALAAFPPAPQDRWFKLFAPAGPSS